MWLAVGEQPFIFMVVTFVKDKSKPHEYLYLKFSSAQNQLKWDRILYMNFRLKDLKRKEMLFLTEYQEEQVEVRKVQAENKRVPCLSLYTFSSPSTSITSTSMNSKVL